MKPLFSLDTRSHSMNNSGRVSSSPFWQQLDFLLACVAAISFWLIFRLVDNTDTALPLLAPLTITFYVLVIIYPILEEIVFRGLIQESLQNLFTTHKLSSRFIGVISSPNLITSISFSLIHLWAHSPIWALATLLPSLVFGYFKDKYQSLYPAIILHIFYNFGYYLLL